MTTFNDLETLYERSCERARSLNQEERDRDTKRICINAECGWEGPESETVMMKHGFPRYLCPDCHEVTEEE